MAFLKKQVKSVLLLLAEEFNTTGISDKNKVSEIIGAITKAGDYDEETARLFLERILIEREELEKALEREERKKALEREDREKALEREERNKALEREEREKDRIFELEKLKIQAARETNIGRPIVSVTESSSKRINLKDLVPKFDPKHIDVALFFTIFERQARKEKVEEENWVSQLISLLPAEIVEVIVKEPEEKADDFQHMKQVLLNRFKMSARTLKEKFEGHNKKHDALWTDLVYELRVYLEGWLDALQISSIEQIKELLITEQIKKRVPGEIREHFLDEWDEIKTASVLAEKCDKFEAVRKDNKRFDRKTFGRNSFKKSFGQKLGQNASKSGKDGKHDSDKDAEIEKRDQRVKSNGNRDREFEKPRKIVCFLCGEIGHIRPSCPKNSDRKDYPIHHLHVKDTQSEFINPLSSKPNLGGNFKPYLKKARINGVDRYYLRDTGTNVDVIDMFWVEGKDLMGKYVSIKQPLDEKSRELPLAWVEIEGSFGKLRTKAAIKPSNVVSNYYVLGNNTWNLIECMEKENENSITMRNENRTDLSRVSGDEKANSFDRVMEKKEERVKFRFRGTGGEQLRLSAEKVVFPLLRDKAKTSEANATRDFFSDAQREVDTVNEHEKEQTSINKDQAVSSVVGAEEKILKVVVSKGIAGVEKNSIKRVDENAKDKFVGILELKRILWNESKCNWNEVLAKILIELNSFTCEKMGISLAELVFGKIFRMPNTTVFEFWILEEDVGKIVMDYISELNGKLKRGPEQRSISKLDDQMKGKFHLHKKAMVRKSGMGDSSEINYTVDLPEKGNQNTIYHANLMKPYHKRSDYVNLKLEERGEDFERDTCIPYLSLNPMLFDFNDLVREGKLENSLGKKKIGFDSSMRLVGCSKANASPGIDWEVKTDEKKMLGCGKYTEVGSDFDEGLSLKGTSLEETYASVCKSNWEDLWAEMASMRVNGETVLTVTERYSLNFDGVSYRMRELTFEGPISWNCHNEETVRFFKYYFKEKVG